MRFEDMIARLKKLDVTAPPGTIRRWATEKLVTPPTRRPRSKGEGRGTTSDWPDQALEEIAAVWALKSFGFTDRDLAGYARRAKEWAECFYEDPIGWELQEKYWLQGDYYDGYNESSFFKGEERSQKTRQLFDYQSVRPIDKDSQRIHWEVMRQLNPHFVNFSEWVAAKEKARHGCPIWTPVNVTFRFCIQGSREDKTLKYRFLGVELKKSQKRRRLEGSRIMVRTEGAHASFRESKDTIDDQTQIEPRNRDLLQINSSGDKSLDKKEG
jgi:hypothetical protein